MGRHKRIISSIMDENAPRNQECKLRINTKDRLMLDSLCRKMNISRSEILRQGLKELYNRHILDE
jgi:hypothetical protein